ncbi:hypothetical protein R1sor_002562 [Riccia sorocarpa]|uniref:Reverse transcriptase n=1 Tax=Riccia sorocarpa TaxID=122646 RepID=A0ABD3GZ66_9MARC
MEVQLTETRDKKRESYFKMNAAELNDPEVMQKTMTARLGSGVRPGERAQRCSRVEAAKPERWLSVEDAPSRYFFTKLKAKWANESMETLTLDSGESNDDQEEIVEGIHSFYQKLFSADPDTPEKVTARKEVVDLIHTRLKEGDSCKLSGVPNKEEIERVIFSMKKGKAPGHDGLTIEVVQKCWEVVGDSCVKMLQAVWAKKGILKADCLAIIKLIHKGDDKKKLANWRPISLMTLT